MGFILSANMEKKNLKPHQKVQEPHKDICLYQIHLLIFSLHKLKDIPELKEVPS